MAPRVVSWRVLAGLATLCALSALSALSALRAARPRTGAPAPPQALAPELLLEDGLPLRLSVAFVTRAAGGAGGWSCERLTRAFAARAARVGRGATRALVEVRPLGALLAEARAAPRGPLHCVPVVVKDNVAVAGMVNAAGSAVLAALLAPARHDAPVVASLRRAGAVVLARANMDEFALGFSTLSTRGGQTLNAYDHNRMPGGSSGGYVSCR
jgi:amidase